MDLQTKETAAKRQEAHLRELAKAIERVDVRAVGALKAHQAVIVKPDLLHCRKSWLAHIPIIPACHAIIGNFVSSVMQDLFSKHSVDG